MRQDGGGNRSVHLPPAPYTYLGLRIKRPDCIHALHDDIGHVEGVRESDGLLADCQRAIGLEAKSCKGEGRGEGGG